MTPARAATYLRTETINYLHPVGLYECGISLGCLNMSGNEAFVSVSITDEVKRHAAGEYRFNALPNLPGRPPVVVGYGKFCDEAEMVPVPSNAYELRIYITNLSVGTCPGPVNGLPFLDDGIKGTITATFFSAN